MNRDWSLVDYNIRSSYSRSDQTVPNIRGQVAGVIGALNGIPDGNPVPVDHVEALARAWSYLTHLDRLIPDVQCWIVGYYWGSGEQDENRAWSTWSGHRDQAEARTYMDAWIKQETSGHSARRKSDWRVRQGPCDIAKFVPEGTDPAVVVEGCFR